MWARQRRPTPPRTPPRCSPLMAGRTGSRAPQGARARGCTHVRLARTSGCSRWLPWPAAAAPCACRPGCTPCTAPSCRCTAGGRAGGGAGGRTQLALAMHAFTRNGKCELHQMTCDGRRHWPVPSGAGGSTRRGGRQQRKAVGLGGSVPGGGGLVPGGAAVGRGRGKHGAAVFAAAWRPQHGRGGEGATHAVPGRWRWARKGMGRAASSNGSARAAYWQRVACLMRPALLCPAPPPHTHLTPHLVLAVDLRPGRYERLCQVAAAQAHGAQQRRVAVLCGGRHKAVQDITVRHNAFGSDGGIATSRVADALHGGAAPRGWGRTVFACVRACVRVR